MEKDKKPEGKDHWEMPYRQRPETNKHPEQGVAWNPKKPADRLTTHKKINSTDT